MAAAVEAEADMVPAGRLRLHWLAGGLWLVAKEANMVRKVVYWLGVAGVAALAAWAVWLSWRAAPAPDAEWTADRFRVLAGVAALVAVPWVGRRRGLFGPVGGTMTARLVRVAGCAAICGIGVSLVRLDSQAGFNGIGNGPFSWVQEIVGLSLFGAVLVAPVMVRARWPQVEASTVWSVIAMAGVVAWLALPVQILTVGYVAGILAATSRRSPVRNATLVAGTIAGVAMGAIVYGVAQTGNDFSFALWAVLLAAIGSLTAIPAGLAAAWQLPDSDNAAELRSARIRQGLLAGAVAGAVAGLMLTLLSVSASLVMVLGPLGGLVGGVLGGAYAADHPRRARDGSWAAGLFISKS